MENSEMVEAARDFVRGRRGKPQDAKEHNIQTEMGTLMSFFASAQLAPYQKALRELVWITEYNLDAQLTCENGSAIPQNHERLMEALAAANELLATEKTDRASL